MRILVYLVFEDYTHAAFTRSADFDVDLWCAMKTQFLADFGVTKVEYEEVAEDFYLPWEEV
jgi:hypothetical protein